jgi:hypothetical protein
MTMYKYSLCTLLMMILLTKVSVAQTATFNSLTVDYFTKSGGANTVWGWGEAADNLLDPRPNYRPDLKTYMINHHSGLTFSAHSEYGGIRFYNQGYPNAYSATDGAVMVMSITNGKVGIGTRTPDAKLSVQGTIHTQEIKVDMNGWSDYVFKPAYHLISLTELKAYIDKHQHLPEIPSEKEVAKNGVNLGDMNKLLLKKVEELTLHLIRKDEQLKAQEKINSLQQKQINEILHTITFQAKRGNWHK